MSKVASVVSRSSTWRRGMSAVLEDGGYEVRQLSSVDEWRPGIGGIAVVADLNDETALESVRRFSEEHPYIPIVALTDQPTLESYARMIRNGVSAVVDESGPLEIVVDVLESVLGGAHAVPLPFLKAMAELVPDGEGAAQWVSTDEADWLRSMAAGATVAEIAVDIGYSERAMFRNLKALYTRIGVRNRTEALIWASRHGLLTA